MCSEFVRKLCGSRDASALDVIKPGKRVNSCSESSTDGWQVTDWQHSLYTRFAVFLHRSFLEGLQSSVSPTQAKCIERFV